MKGVSRVFKDQESSLARDVKKCATNGIGLLSAKVFGKFVKTNQD